MHCCRILITTSTSTYRDVKLPILAFTEEVPSELFQNTAQTLLSQYLRDCLLSGQISSTVIYENGFSASKQTSPTVPVLSDIWIQSKRMLLPAAKQGVVG
jgi:hypothetical protein